MAETHAHDDFDHATARYTVRRLRRLAMALLAALLLPLLTGCGTLRMARAMAGGGDPLTPQEHIQLGVAYEQEGEYDAALKQFEIAAKYLKADPVPRTNIANIHVLKGDLATAESQYGQAIKIDPSYAPALNNLAWLLLQRGGDLREAELYVYRALAQDPENPDYLDTLAEIQQAARDVGSP